MEIQSIAVDQNLEGLVLTETGTREYRETDYQISNTASVQHLFLSGTSSVVEEVA